MMGTKMYEEYADHVKINVWVELFDLNAEFFIIWLYWFWKFQTKAWKLELYQKNKSFQQFQLK